MCLIATREKDIVQVTFKDMVVYKVLTPGVFDNNYGTSPFLYKRYYFTNTSFSFALW